LILNEKCARGTPLQRREMDKSLQATLKQADNRRPQLGRISPVCHHLLARRGGWPSLSPLSCPLRAQPDCTGLLGLGEFVRCISWPTEPLQTPHPRLDARSTAAAPPLPLCSAGALRGAARARLGALAHLDMSSARLGTRTVAIRFGHWHARVRNRQAVHA
jgi:hypothetical protein